MYLDFYGIREMPFNMAPDLRYIFKTENYLDVLGNVQYCIEYSKGLMLLTGEVGTGKTTTLRLAMSQLGLQASSFCFFNPLLTTPEFFEQLCYELGLSRPTSKPDLLTTLNKLLTLRAGRGEYTILIIDEAHALTPTLLEEVRLLLNFETNGKKLLQIILCGHPELRDMIPDPSLRQLKQRVSAYCELKPMRRYETEKYIRFRLKTAGARRVDLFDDEAIQLICDIACGMPRVINNLCDNALRYGALAGNPRISAELINKSADRLGLGALELTH